MFYKVCWGVKVNKDEHQLNIIPETKAFSFVKLKTKQRKYSGTAIKFEKNWDKITLV